MKWADRGISLVFVVIAAVWLYLAVQLPFPAFSRVSKMGPGHYPMGVAILIGLLALILFVQTFRGAAAEGGESSNTDECEEDEGSRNPKAVQHLLIGFGLFLGYIVLVAPLGFLLASALFVFLFLWLIQRANLIVTGLLAAGIPVLLWVIFGYWLAVPLPKGLGGF